GTGTLIFPAPNTYSGKTLVNAGVLNLQNANGLGSGGSEVQQLTILGANGSFRLQFNGQTTPPTASPALDITSPTLAADIQNALNNLLATSNPGAFVTVVKGP